MADGNGAISIGYSSLSVKNATIFDWTGWNINLARYWFDQANNWRITGDGSGLTITLSGSSVNLGDAIQAIYSGYQNALTSEGDPYFNAWLSATPPLMPTGDGSGLSLNGGSIFFPGGADPDNCNFVVTTQEQAKWRFNGGGYISCHDWLETEFPITFTAIHAGSIMTFLNAPAATDDGTVGQMIFTDDYTYRCFGTGDWRRTPVTYSTY